MAECESRYRSLSQLVATGCFGHVISNLTLERRCFDLGEGVFEKVDLTGEGEQGGYPLTVPVELGVDGVLDVNFLERFRPTFEFEQAVLVSRTKAV